MIFLIISAVILCVFIAFACDEELTVGEYTFSTDKIKGQVVIAQISDLHNELYGENQSLIMQKLDIISPDIVVLTGDIADPRNDDTHAFELCSLLAEKYPVYYVIGNHENAYKGKVSKIVNRFVETGVKPLRGDGEKVTIGENTLLICGVDDPWATPDSKLRYWEDELADCNGMIEDGVYSILLSHRPERPTDYAETDFDLILTGHAHGGQVRIPFILEQGVFAPMQGWFPKYTSGSFELKEGQTMIVSRGLSKLIRPRVFNKPEIVSITLKEK